MPVLALVLVLVAAVIHASWNLVAKRTGGDVRFILLLQLGVALIWAPVGFWFAWREVPGYGLLHWGLIGASGLLHAGYLLVLLQGYRLGDLSVVYPLARGTGPLITALLASLVLGEALGWQGAIGVGGVACGIFLIAGGPKSLALLRSAPGASEDLIRLRHGIGYGLLTGLFIAAYSVVDGYAVKVADISPVSVDYLGNLARLPFTVLLLVWRSKGHAVGLRRVWSEQRRAALTIAAISPVAYVLVLYAARLAPLSHVAPAREVSMLFAALLGGSLLREGNVAQRVVGALCITVGVIVLASA
jgi:drug/metabolite transporter (DMT)-like permease